MNKSAERHLAKAKDYLTKGDEFYRKAKPEIDAAHAEGATDDEIRRYLRKSETWVRDVRHWDGEGTLYGKNTEARQKRQAKQVLRESSPEEVAALLDDPDIRLNVARGQQIHQEDREAKGKEREREALGDELVDGLDLKQKLTDLQMSLINARGNIGGFIRQGRDLDLSEAPDVWREECLGWIDTLSNDLGMAKALLEGGTIDDEDLAELLKGGV